MRLPPGGGPVALMLEAAEGRVANGEMGADAPLDPVEDRTDPEIVLVGTETGLDFQEPAVLDDQIAGIGVAASPCDYAPRTVPAGCFGDLTSIACALLVGCPPVADDSLWQARTRRGSPSCVSNRRRS